MKFTNSIQSQITKLFLGFTFVLSLIFSLLLLGYSWVVEDNIFNRIVKNEAEFILEQYKQSNQIVHPRSEFVSLYENWQELPGNVFHLHQLDPERIEFNLPSGGSLHVRQMVIGNKSYILAADVSKIEIGKEYLPYVSVWLVIIVLIISGLSLLISLVMARKTLKPLERLTEKVSSSKYQKIDQKFSKEFPDNEVGYLAKTFEESILHVQKVLQRESDFTRDVSHELRTPITILRNIQTKTKDHLKLDQKDFNQFSYAVSQLKLSVTTLLALAREESTELEELNFIKILEDCIINHYELSKNERFNLNIDVPNDFKVSANQILLKILLNNLLTNAVNYASGKSLSIKLVGSDIYFENRASHFELEDPFKANSRGNNSLGIGLGLNIVQRLCTAFNWRASLKSDDEMFCIIISTSPN